MRTSVKCALFVVVCLFLTNCSCGGVAGEYSCDGGLLDSMKLQSNGKAYLTMKLFGQSIEKGGTYAVDGDKVIITIDGQSNVFTKKGDVLDGGMQGKCKSK